MSTIKSFVLLMMLVVSNASMAYVECRGFKIDTISTSSSARFHRMDLGGAVGSMIFVVIDKAQCSASSDEDISKGVFLLIDNLEDQQDSLHELKKYWQSLLLAAKAAGSTVSFHANLGGYNTVGAAVVKPYYLHVN